MMLNQIVGPAPFESRFVEGMQFILNGYVGLCKCHMVPV